MDSKAASVGDLFHCGDSRRPRVPRNVSFVAAGFSPPGTRPTSPRCIYMSREPRRKPGILLAIARRLRAFYKSLLDDSAKEAHELFDRAAQRK